LVFAQETGFPVQINTTITRKNFRMIDELAAMMQELEIDLWSVRFAVMRDTPTDRARIGPKEYEWVFERLWEHALRQPYVIETVDAPQYRRFVYLQPRQHSRYTQRMTSPRVSHRGFTTLGGNDGKGTLFIGHTGLIFPSESLPMVCGMFPQQRVIDVYQQARLMQGLRDPMRLEGKCHRCEFRYVCGGCRGRAYAVTGNPFAQEPDCSYRPIGLVEEKA
jgi:radical SAM protein with 4Fe4S-binding SPASM domain